jgi:hypothetical protein
MKSLFYGREFEAHADHVAEGVAMRLRTKNVKTSTENVELAARTLIKEGKLDCNEVEFVYVVDGKEVCRQKSTKDGRLREYPAGYCEVAMDLLTRLF